MTAQVAKSRLKALSIEYITLSETMACWNDDDNDYIDTNPGGAVDSGNNNNSISNSIITKLKNLIGINNHE